MSLDKQKPLGSGIGKATQLDNDIEEQMSANARAFFATKPIA